MITLLIRACQAPTLRKILQADSVNISTVRNASLLKFPNFCSKTIMALRILGVAGLALGVHFWRKYWRNELSDERGYEVSSWVLQ